MEIIFNHKCFELANINLIAKEKPMYSGLINFINEWINQKQEFSFQTSGSTGTPKNTKITRSQIEASVNMTKKALELSPDDNVLVCLNPEYIATIMMVARCLILDLNMIIVEPSSNPFRYLSEERRIDFASFVPFQIEEIFKNSDARRLVKIKNILIGGAAISNQLIENLKSIDTKIYQSYGMTETVSHIALMNLHTEDNFHCLEGIKIRKNENDCLAIQGKVTNNLWIQTNDIIDLKSKSEFKWLGRLDNVINSGGIKIFPEELEKHSSRVLDQFHFKNNFFFYGKKDEIFGEILCLIFEEKVPEQTILETLQNSIIKRFSKYYLPKEIRAIDRFATTNSGKVKRKETVKKL